MDTRGKIVSAPAESWEREEKHGYCVRPYLPQKEEVFLRLEWTGLVHTKLKDSSRVFFYSTHAQLYVVKLNF